MEQHVNDPSQAKVEDCHCYGCREHRLRNCRSLAYGPEGEPECKTYFDCRTGTSPAGHPGFKVLGGLGVVNDPSFQEFNCNTRECGANKPTYFSHDPRLIQDTTGELLVLDRPPLTGKVRMNDVPCPNYGTGQCQNQGKGIYAGYEDIHTGQYQYYIDKETADAFYQPVYAMPSESSAYLYKTPMGVARPQYELCSKVSYGNNPAACQGEDGYWGCLSEINDLSAHREDIISKQQRLSNRSKYSAWWYPQ